MEIIKIKPQTVIMFVGPIECGKSHFAENVLIPQLIDQNRFFNKQLNIQYLSSDHARIDLLGHNYVELSNDNRMDHVSEQAFTMLRTKLAAVLSYPVNADFVVVDTTGMSTEFRKEISDITFKGNYSLQLFVFDFKNRNEYFEFVGNDFLEKKKVSDSVKRFKDKMSELTKKDFPNQTRIKSNKYANYKIEIDGGDSYSDHFLDRRLDYVIIGDVHGCFDELKQLLCEHDFVFTDDNFVAEIGRTKEGEPLKIIFIGDIIDKGDQIAKTINFVDYLVSEGYALLLRGNHENFVYNYMKGVKHYMELDREFINTFLSTVGILENNERLKETFFNLFEKAKDFYATDRFIVTHAPCKIEFLGKVKGHCLKNQRNFRFARRAEFLTEEDFIANSEKEMGFMKEEARYNNPYHIVGHVMLPNVVQFNNKLMIDTGCVAGGKLTSVIIHRTGAPQFKSVKSNRPLTGEIFPIFTGAKKFEISELDPREQTRIKYLCLDKVNFISGTMAPADKDHNNNVLESLDQAIKYYKDAGVKKITLQPKFMGSRGNVYLFKDIKQCYIVSRNGYKLKENTMEYLQPALQKLIDRMFNVVRVENRTIKMFLLDAEILPWDLLGSGLIRQHFKPVAMAVKTETEILMEHGFEKVLEEYKLRPEYQQYMNDRRRNVLTKDQLTELYGHTKERTLRNIHDYKHLNLVDERNFGENFSSQLEIHAGESIEPAIEPFAILKLVYDDDHEYVYENESNIENFELVSDRPYAVIDLEQINFNEPIGQQSTKIYNHESFDIGTWPIDEFFKYVTITKKMEGVVAKPEKVYTPGIAPYIKVRNENYLTIVYGHNYKFEHKFNKLINKKGVKKKLQTSIKEFELGMKMLKTPYSKISPENEPYKQLLAQMIIEVEKEKQLDPRL